MATRNIKQGDAADVQRQERAEKAREASRVRAQKARDQARAAREAQTPDQAVNLAPGPSRGEDLGLGVTDGTEYEPVETFGATGTGMRNREARQPEPVFGVEPELSGAFLNEPHVPAKQVNDGTERFQETYRSADRVRFSDTGNEGVIAVNTDNVFANPSGQLKMPAPTSGVSGGDSRFEVSELDRIVAEHVAAALKAAGVSDRKIESATGVQGGSPVVNVTGTSQPRPEGVLKHYRNDMSPDMRIAAMDMDVIDGGGRPTDAIILGEFLVFRRGHFFATTENQVRQIEWLRTRPTHNPLNPEEVVGGVPTIYEDDGGGLHSCFIQGCGFITGSYNGLKAHLRATHNVVVE